MKSCMRHFSSMICFKNMLFLYSDYLIRIEWTFLLFEQIIIVYYRQIKFSIRSITKILIAQKKKLALQFINNMFVNIRFFLTFVDNDCFFCYLFCISILDQKLQNFFDRNFWKISKSFIYFNCDNSSSFTFTQIAIDCFLFTIRRKSRQKNFV